MARKLTNISKWSCAKETLQDDQWKSLLSCFKSFNWAKIGEIMQQEIWMQLQTLVQQSEKASWEFFRPRPWRLCHLRKPDQQVSHHRTSLCCPTWPCRCLKWDGWWENWDNDSEWFAMKVTESRESQNALNPGRIFPFSVAKKATFDRNFTNFRPLFEKIIQLDYDFFSQFFLPLGALMRATFHILNWAHFDQHLHLRLQVLNCWWSQRPRHWNEGSWKELGTVGVILIKLINPQKKNAHFQKNSTEKTCPKKSTWDDSCSCDFFCYFLPVVRSKVCYCPTIWKITYIFSPTLRTRKVNALDRHSDTPLSWAARSGHLDAVGQDPATKHGKKLEMFFPFCTTKKGEA